MDFFFKWHRRLAGVTIGWLVAERSEAPGPCSAGASLHYAPATPSEFFQAAVPAAAKHLLQQSDKFLLYLVDSCLLRRNDRYLVGRLATRAVQNHDLAAVLLG